MISDRPNSLLFGRANMLIIFCEAKSNARRRQNMSDLIAEYVRDILDYDPDSGNFIWRARCDVPQVWNAMFAHKPAGFRRDDGRLMITINYKHYIAARLAWLMMTGNWPKPEVDHRDTDRSNDRWENLRQATGSQNQHNKPRQKNNTSGIKGVSWSEARKKWLAQICVRGKNRNLGRFETIEGAQAAYLRASDALHKEYSRAA
jgi:hypothetical protein